jgi:hypothetical protein
VNEMFLNSTKSHSSYIIFKTNDQEMQFVVKTHLDIITNESSTVNVYGHKVYFLNVSVILQ